MVAEKFEVSGVKIIGRYAPKQNSPPGRKKLPISSNQGFPKICFSPSRKGEDYGAEKMTKVKLVRVLVTSFDKFHHLCNLHIFGLCFVLLHNLDSSILKNEDSLIFFLKSIQ